MPLVQDALKKLDRLTGEELSMTVVEILKVAKANAKTADNTLAVAKEGSVLGLSESLTAFLFYFLQSISIFAPPRERSRS
jgi:hypothetical protein